MDGDQGGRRKEDFPLQFPFEGWTGKTGNRDSTPYILSVVAPLPSEVFTRMLMDKGFCVSSGSACSNNAKGKSEGILEAMGIPNQKAKKAIRISMGRNTTEEEVIRLLENS